jgi:hypothetical protein
MGYEVVIPSHRPGYADEARRSLFDEPARIFANTGYPSFSKLVNDCVRSSNVDTIIICNDKVRATRAHVRHLLQLLGEGWGLVGLNQFHFFGFPRELFRRVGGFDERFLGGEFEDDDYLLRMMEADIAYCGLVDVPEHREVTSWSRTVSAEMFARKWEVTEHGVRRKLQEGGGYHDFGQPDGRPFNPWSYSSTTGWVGAKYIGLKMLEPTR